MFDSLNELYFFKNDQKSTKFFCQDALIHHVFLEKDKFGNN